MPAVGVRRVVEGDDDPIFPRPRGGYRRAQVIGHRPVVDAAAVQPHDERVVVLVVVVVALGIGQVEVAGKSHGAIVVVAVLHRQAVLAQLGGGEKGSVLILVKGVVHLIA